MMEIIIAILFIMLFFGIIKIALKLTWSIAKFIFGLGLFFICPLAFVVLAITGMLGTLWLAIVIVALVCAFSFALA